MATWGPVFSGQCAVYSVQSTVCHVHCTVYSMQCTGGEVYSVHWTMCSGQCTIFTVYCAVHLGIFPDTRLIIGMDLVASFKIDLTLTLLPVSRLIQL